MMNTTRILACLMTLALFAAPALAGEDWEFALTPYLWFAGLDGRVSSVSGQPPAEVDASFSDILDNLDLALFVAGEARKDRWGVMVDLMYVDVEAGGDFPGPEFSSVNLQSTIWMASALGLYRLHDDDGRFADLLAGVRYWDASNELMLGAGEYPDTELETCDSWVDPMVGLKGRTPIGESRFSFGGHLMAGGFGAASDMVWDLRVDFGYHWEKTSVILGYRYLDVDYEDGDFVFDVTQDGPILGLIFRF